MYADKDFDNLPWNPIRVKKDVDQQWRPLTAYKEFQYPLGNLDRDLFLNYMCLVYHKDSVLVADFENAKDRKYKALELLDVPHSNGKYSEHIERLINNNHESADLMIIRFCSLLNNQRYSLFVTLGMTYDKLMKQIYETSQQEDLVNAVKDTGTLNKHANDILRSLDDLKKELFAKDKHISDKADEEFLSYARVPGYPEMLAHGKIEIR
jgi:hypothetical protein